MSLCECGCGETTRRRDGKPNRYVHGHNARGKKQSSETVRRRSEALKGRKSPSGPDHYAWRGGRVILGNGYVSAWVGRDHPMADRHGRVYEHRLVMAEQIGRPLTAEEVVHHKDSNRQNNDPANLMLFASHHLHLRYEQAQRAMGGAS